MMSTKLSLRDAGRIKDVAKIDFCSTFPTIPLADMVSGLPSMKAVCDDGKLVLEKNVFCNGDFLSDVFGSAKTSTPNFCKFSQLAIFEFCSMCYSCAMPNF